LKPIATAVKRNHPIAPIAHGEPVKANSTRPTSDSVERFCERHGISEATFYRRRSDMPRAIKIGGQLRIIDVDEQTWIERKQAEAQGRAA
jgi:predicted DNA-binding transcriptional regulator AlpA